MPIKGIHYRKVLVEGAFSVSKRDTLVGFLELERPSCTAFRGGFKLRPFRVSFCWPILWRTYRGPMEGPPTFPAKKPNP